jgi:hypothetical protein
MDEAIITKLFELAPQLVFLVLFLVAFGFLLKEYRTLRTEMKESVEDAVNVGLGSMMGKLQIENVKASQLLEDITSTYQQSQDFSEQFEQKLSQRASQINNTFETLERKLAVLQESVPEHGDVKYSAHDFAALASNVTSRAEAFHLLEQAKEDTDATSKDLEVAGDVARKFRRFSLAREFYERAVELDP